MLPRVLEAEVMDTEAEAREYDSMDFAEVNRAFVTDFFRAWTGVGLILDVWTGTARIPIELCRRYEAITGRASAEEQQRRGHLLVCGVDLSEHMLELGRRNVAEARLNSPIYLAKSDAKRLGLLAAHFGAVICNGSVHHFPDPGACLAEMHRVCIPGCTIFVRDLLRPVSEGALDDILNAHAAEANDHQRAMFAASLRASLTLDEVRAAVGRLGYGPEAVQQTSDRHWTWSAARI